MKWGRNIVFSVKFQQKIAVVTLTILAILGCILLGSSIMEVGNSKAADEDNTYKYYTSIQIEPGDSLWSIASQYISEEYDSMQDYVDEVKSLNGLGDDEIHSGQFLIIPYYSYDFK